MAIFEKYWYFIIPTVIIVVFCICLCLGCLCKHVCFHEQQVDVENGIKFHEETPLHEITSTRYNTTRVYIENDTSETEEESQEIILRVKSPYKNGYRHIPIPAILYRRHFHRNLNRQNALSLSKRRKGYLAENTVFEDPGKLLECRLVGRNLLSGNLNEVFYVSPKALQTIQCYYSKKHYKWTKAVDSGYKWAVFKSKGDNYHFEKNCLQYNKVIFT